MKSMTGYGRGVAGGGGAKFTVEVNSVNRRQSDVSISLPKEYAALESPLRDVVHQAVSRGRLNVVVDASFAKKEQRVEVDLPLARQIAAAIREIQGDLGTDAPLDFEAVFRTPGVIRTTEERLAPDTALPLIREALDAALAALTKMREREGKHLARDLIGRLKLVRQTIRRIRQLHPGVMRRYRDTLVERIANAGFDLDAEDGRLLRELAWFADRSDISEELTRLESHLAQFAHKLRSTDPVGRPLDFLIQEITRELNTLGAKSNDAEIAQCVVACKSEMEKIREQVQNIE